MGVFHEQVEIVNRTSRPLTVRYDGQDKTIYPNYKEDGTRIDPKDDSNLPNMVPKIVVPFALNQNVWKGTESFRNPSAFKSLVGVVDKRERKKHSWHDCGFVSQAEVTKCLTRVPIEKVIEDDPTVKGVVVRGKINPNEDDAMEGLDTVPTPFDIRMA